MDEIDKIYELLEQIQITEDNQEMVANIKNNLVSGNILGALKTLKELQQHGFKTKEEQQQEELEEQIKEENDSIIYAESIASDELEEKYIGKLLNEIKAIAMYYFPFKECFFVNEELLNLYKTVLFTDAEKYAPEAAKQGFNFARRTQESDRYKYNLREKYKGNTESMEKVYTDLKKLFILRKRYLEHPVKVVQAEIAKIIDYQLYDQMSPEEVDGAIEQITATEKFKRAILNEEITEFLVKGNNALTTGLSIPFPILTSVFKGIRVGETMAFAMPSNSGKSRFTMNLAAYIALMHQKKVLLISNEMSEEKMRLCLITTIINNPDIQKLHGVKMHKSETELLEFWFRPDDPKSCKVDENGFIVKEEKETQLQFVARLRKISKEFNMVISVTDWFNKQVSNYIYFINITDHTNDELKKVIMNYYYKEKVEYVFYDTLKTDIDNIGNGEEIKRTATILANLAQNFKMYIGSTLQLSETSTDPVNLNINDLAVSRTVKEVLDALCLFKQIHTEDLGRYEYSLNEVDTKFFPLEKFKDPDVRYYSCVVDKNRAGSKPKLVFRLNLAYNEWNELGYLRLKSGATEEAD